MKNIKHIKDIVSLLNSEFPPEPVIIRNYFNGVVFETKTVCRKPHFTAFLVNKRWVVYCDNYGLFYDDDFTLYKKEIIKHFVKELKIGILIQYAHPINIDLLILNKQFPTVAPLRETQIIVS